MSYMNKIIDVVCASTMTMAVTSSGHCFSWGQSGTGALGLGKSLKSVVKPTLIDKFVSQYKVSIEKVAISATHSLFLACSG